MKIKEIAIQIRERIPVPTIRAEDYISTDNMRPNFGGIDTSSSLPPSGTVTSYQAGDILLSNIRPYFRKTWLATHSGGCNADVLCIRTNPEKCIPNFLYYLFTTDNFVNDYLKSCKGAKMPRGDVQRLLDYDFHLPDLPTQLRIAGLLGSIDEKIELNRRKIAELEALAKTLYDYWFVQFDFSDKNGRPYKSSGGKMVWNDQLKREVPEGWEVKDLKSILIICSGKDHKHLPDGEYPILGSGGIMRHGAEYLYDGESVLIPRKGTLNNVMFMHSPFWTVDTMFYTRPKRDNLMKYVYMTIRNFDFARLNTGTGVPSMTTSIINRIAITIPPDKLAREFEICIGKLFERIDTAKSEIATLHSFRDAILPLLMNGQVEVRQ